METIHYSIEPRTRKHFNMDFCHLQEIYPLFNTATKAGLNALKTAAKTITHKAAEATGEFIGNKIADKIVDANSRNAEEIVIPPEKREKILNEVRQAL